MSEIYRFDAEKHRHYINGVMVPGVTTISGTIDDGKSGALQGWAAKLTAQYIVSNLRMVDGAAWVGDLQLTPETAGGIFSAAKKNYKDVRDTAADLGTRVHDLCEKYWAQPDIQPAQEDERPAFEAFKRWVAAYSVKMVETERHVYSLEENYAGILDLVALVNGEKYIVDIKTSSRISPGFMVQVGGYAYAREEMTKEDLSHAGILRLDKEGGVYEWCDFSDHLSDATMNFLHARWIYEDLKKYNKAIRAAVKEAAKEEK